MTTLTTNVHHTGRTRAPRPAFWQRMKTMFAVRRQRRDLADLEPHLLRDIGLSREAADRESNRKLWDVPQHWLR